MTIEMIETINLVLFFASTGLLGAIRFFEGWKSFFKALAIWIVVLGVSGMIVSSLNGDLNDGVLKVAGMIILIIFNLVYGGYLFKKGYLGSIFFR